MLISLAPLEQLGIEGQEEKDHRYRPNEALEGCEQEVQERFQGYVTSPTLYPCLPALFITSHVPKRESLISRQMFNVL